jgi:hypothetical protein
MRDSNLAPSLDNGFSFKYTFAPSWLEELHFTPHGLANRPGAKECALSGLGFAGDCLSAHIGRPADYGSHFFLTFGQMSPKVFFCVSTTIHLHYIVRIPRALLRTVIGQGDHVRFC